MDGHMDRQTQGKRLFLHTITMRESDVASLVEFRPVAKEEIAWRTEGRSDGWMEGRMNGGIHNIFITFLKKCGDNILF